MSSKSKIDLSDETLSKFYELNKQKKEIEFELSLLKDLFHDYFDNRVGPLTKGEFVLNGYKLQRQIRRTEKYDEQLTIERLEKLKMTDLIQVIRKPDDSRIKSAINLGLITQKDLDGCHIITESAALSIKPIKPR
ncbi:hypothetical protein [Mesobacillus harenae]|uniref:hypothetical protein n=1 Tax=Mesobacillus harenae TaxID=2213203 RepID=UPI001F54FF63|nr:hypothetical protein [Mesobacillus harenae]